MTERVQVVLHAVLDAMNFQSDEMTAYVQRSTGRVIVVSDEAMRDAEDGADADFGGEAEELADALAILKSPDEYLPLPDRFEIDEYRMMEHFAAGVAADSARAQLQDSMHGRGAFRRFKDTAHRLGFLDAWYAYRDRSYEALAREWCEEQGLAVDARKADA